jgi:RNA polymerase sigma factor (TIGR02999 family)
LDHRDAEELIARWRGGDAHAYKELLPAVYEELRRVAHRHLHRERPDHTLQTTALIHEAYLRIAATDGAKIRNRIHFVALSSRLMRRVLVDHARSRLAEKRDGGVRVTMSEASDATEDSEIDVLFIDEALGRLAELDRQQAEVVELRFFGGMSIPETSEALNVSAATVKRDWATARAWLRRELLRSGRA